MGAEVDALTGGADSAGRAAAADGDVGRGVNWATACLRLVSSPLIWANICSCCSKIAVRVARVGVDVAGSAESILAG